MVIKLRIFHSTRQRFLITQNDKQIMNAPLLMLHQATGHSPHC